MKVVTEEAVRMSDGKLFHAVGPATQNARLPRRRLVRGTTRSPRAAEDNRIMAVEGVEYRSSYMLSDCENFVSKRNNRVLSVLI